MSATFTNRLLSLDEASEKLNVSRSTVYRLVGAGHLPAIKIGRATRISASAVEQFIADAPRAKIAPEIR